MRGSWSIFSSPFAGAAAADVRPAETTTAAPTNAGRSGLYTGTEAAADFVCCARFLFSEYMIVILAVALLSLGIAIGYYCCHSRKSSHRSRSSITEEDETLDVDDDEQHPARNKLATSLYSNPQPRRGRSSSVSEDKDGVHDDISDIITPPAWPKSPNSRPPYGKQVSSGSGGTSLLRRNVNTTDVSLPNEKPYAPSKPGAGASAAIDSSTDRASEETVTSESFHKGTYAEPPRSGAKEK